MEKGYCEKRAGKKCSKCFCEDTYRIINEIPCKHFVYNSKGYEGTLKDIKGTKIRRQWFFTPMVMSIGLIALFLIAVSIMNVMSGSEVQQEDKDFLLFFFRSVFSIEFLLLISFEFLLLILSILNTKFFGKIVAVINDDGVYTNQMFLKWDNISEIEFFPRVIKEHHIDDCAYTKIVSAKKVYNVAHMPLYFLLKAKRYNPKIKIKINKKTILFYMILSLIWIIVPIVISLIDS